MVKSYMIYRKMSIGVIDNISQTKRTFNLPATSKSLCLLLYEAEADGFLNLVKKLAGLLKLKLLHNIQKLLGISKNLIAFADCTKKIFRLYYVQS